MTTVLTNSVTTTGNYRIDGLVEGSKWNLSGTRTLTYSFHDTADGSWTYAGKAMVAGALNAWSCVANINFVQDTSVPTYVATEYSPADMAFTAAGAGLANLAEDAVAAGIFPDANWAASVRGWLGDTTYTYRQPEGDVYLDQRYLFPYSAQGSYGFMVTLHEIGHALGLKHPHDDGGTGKPTFTDLGVGGYDHGIYTVMSYNDTNLTSFTGGYQATPMPWDILAIQHLYGANMSYHAGADTYYLGASGTIWTIWDAGGMDTISASFLTERMILDLNEGATNWVNSNTAVAIAYNVTIENGVGGSGHDIIKGNAAANSLSGGYGADMLYGNGGNDTLNGGFGNDILDGGAGDDVYVADSVYDTVIENYYSGNDTLQTALSGLMLASNVERLLYTGVTGGVLYGNGEDNTLQGGAGNDTLVGWAGTDLLIGGAGNDVYMMSDDWDSISDSGGSDTITAQISTFSLASYGSVEKLSTSLATAFTGTGNALANLITGTAAGDTLDGGAGADTLNGGLGNDVYVLGDLLDTILDAGGIDTIASSLSTFSLASYGMVENLRTIGAGAFVGTGNGLANLITGGSSGDTLSGGVGNDTLDGGAGNDTLLGGVGDDVFVVDAVGDVVSEAAGEGIDTIRSLLSTYTLAAANVEVLSFGGTGAFTGTGNGLANTIFGGTGNDTLDGGAGNDLLAGGAGNDTYMLDSAADMVSEAAGAGTDTVVAMAATFTLIAANVEIMRYGGGGAFTGIGNALANTIIGGTGNDTLDGAAGADWLGGGAGNDTYVVDNVGDWISEGAGAGQDRVVTSLAAWTLGAEQEILEYTGSGAFSGTGNSGDNTIIGGAGNDTLTGGGGNDILEGGAGDDVYIVDDPYSWVHEAADGGFDTMRTSLWSRLLEDDVEVLQYTGSGTFEGYGNNGANLLIGGGGGDWLDGSGGGDLFLGGAGDDTYVIYNLGERTFETVEGGRDTAFSFAAYGSLFALFGVENLEYGGVGDFTGVGNLLNNALTGDVGNDTLDGGRGDDTLNGDEGNDWYMVDSLGDVVVDSAGTDTIETTLSSYDLAAAATVEILRHAGAGGFSGLGNALANTLVGGGGNDVLDGRGGADLLLGGGGNDRLTGGTGDTLDGGAGNDTYVIEASGVTITEAVSGGIDTVRTALSSFDLGASAANVESLIHTGSSAFVGIGTAAANTLVGGGGSDTLDGAGGDDMLSGGVGADTLIGGAGTDTADYRGALGGVRVNLGGDDATLGGVLVAAGTARDGWNGIDSLDGIEIVLGSGSADFLRAATGGARLDGGGGNDVLVGNAGDDVFVFGRNGGGDTVQGFDGAHDRLDFSGLNLSTDIILSHVTTSGGNSIISLETLGGGRVEVVGVTNLTSSHLLV